ncbi:MAG: glycosyltransferase [Sphingomonadales bacterium]|nr:glycosyltransferase [Sphingomonadales bacterium]
MTAPRRILHLHSSFDPGGKEMRAVQLINGFGRACAHDIVSAVPGALGAAARIARKIAFATPEFPGLQGRPGPRRLHRLARAMRGYDLVLTYNFGAMDAVLAHTLFARALALPPLVHHEDGFNADEAAGLKPVRNWYRRIALGGIAALVVPSRRLEAIACDVWHQPPERVHRIANGIATSAYGARPKPDALPRIVKREGELWLGALAGLRPVKNLPRLVRAFAGLPEPWQLVILGEGPCRDEIRAAALALGIAHRVHLPGFIAEPARVIDLFDCFALSSDSEQFPLSVVEAMAAGLAVAATDVGDVKAMLAEENRGFVVPAGDEAALADALARLAADAGLRARLGRANRALARACFDEAAMIAAYRAVYARAMRRDSFP